MDEDPEGWLEERSASVFGNQQFYGENKSGDRFVPHP